MPDEVRPSLLLSDEELHDELLVMTDRYTDELFRLPTEVATTVAFPVSRLVVDPERFVDDAREPMAAQGMGAIYTRTSKGTRLRRGLSADERAELLARYYDPHHARLCRAVRAALETYSQCLLVDGHSFSSKPLPHEPDQAPNRPDICVGTDDFHTPVWLTEMVTAAFRKQGFLVEVNRPFAGALVPSEFCHQEGKVYALMVEINRSLYMDESSGRRLRDFGVVLRQLQGILMELASAAS